MMVYEQNALAMFPVPRVFLICGL